MKTLTLTSIKILSLIALLSISVITQKVFAQAPYKAIAGSQIKVLGTSNLHDWDMTSAYFNCEGNLTLTDGVLKDINSLSFVLPVKNLKAKEDLMNTRAYKALKESDFDKISFKLTEANVVSQQKIIKATGNLTIGGVTNKITLQTTYTVNADESITCKGTKLIKMTDYKINPPSFMMGALKTGNEVTIDLQLKLKKQ